MNPSGQFKTTNYMVPSNGQTHAVVFQGQFSSVPALIDWRQYAIDNEKFQPQGVFMDNTAGTVPLVVTILPINYPVSCPVGQTLQAQFPAPNGQTATITGDPANTATVIFVDFPILPSNNQTQIVGLAQVNIASVTPGTVIGTDPNPLAAGNTLPYRTQEYVPAAEVHSTSITGAAVSSTVIPTVANQNLRKLKITLSGNATLAVAGTLTLTVTLNGVTIYSVLFYVGATTPANSPALENLTGNGLDFDNIGLPAAAGNLVVTLSAALATGAVNINSYFTPQ
jgi:hypothetical protein